MGWIETLSAVVQGFLNLGASVAIPIILFFIALGFRVKPGRAARSAITIAVGFVGINLLIGYFMDTISPVAKMLVKRTGIQLVAIDVGWPSAAAIAFGSPLGTLIIPVTVAVNLILLAAKVTRTLDVDVWNYWHFAFVASLTYIATGDFWLGLLAGIAMFVVILPIADWSAPKIQEMLQTPAISLPHGFSAPYFALAYPVMKLFQKIPSLWNIRADPETIRKRFGLIGETPVLGAIIGFALSVAAGADYVTVAKTTVGMAAVMVILPRMVRILMEGLVPLADAIRETFVKRYAGKRELYIGLDSAIAIGHPVAIAASLILIPIFIAESLIPGNKILLLADLPVIPFMVCMTVPLFNYDTVKVVINMAIWNIVGLLLGSTIIDIYTATAKSVGFPLPKGALFISSICDGTNPLTWFLIQLGRIGWRPLAYGALIVVIIVSIIIGYIAEKRRVERAAKAAATSG